VSSTPLRSEEARTAPSDEGARWGSPAPALMRSVAIAAWLALVARLLSNALPGSRSGIGAWIRRADAASSFLAQTAALFGSSLLVLLVVGTLAERSLGYAYRLVAVATGGAILMLVMLASTMGLDPEASLTLGLACLLLATASATVAMNSPASRAQGLVVSLVTLGAAARLAVRVFAAGTGHHDASWATRVTWLAAAGEGFDALGIALAAARLRAEHRMKASGALAGVVVLALLVAWNALRGSGDGASTWQVLASRALGDLAQAAAATGPLGTRFAVETLAILLAGAIVLWPGRISAGMISVGLALLARPSVDVPAAALVLAVGALVAPLGRAPVIDTSRAFSRSDEPGEPRTVEADR
jgi:hypothetical protein